MPEYKVGRDTYSKPQLDFMRSTARFKMWRGSRRQGKTEALQLSQAKKAIKNPDTVNWYVAQDLALCNELNIPLFRAIVPPELITGYSKSSRTFTLFNKSKSYFKTANSSDSLRGRKVNDLACEEPTYWQNGGDIFHNILRPQLSDTMGTCSIVFTPPTQKAPKGAEWVRRLELMWREEIKAGNPDYAVFHNTIWDSPYITEAEKKNLERMTDPETWNCEYLAQYNDKQGTVYWEFDPLTKKDNLDNVPVTMRVRGLDWGLDDNTACAWVSVINPNKIYVSDEHSENNLDVPEQADRVKAKTLWPVVWTILDSACWARLPGIESVAKRFATAGIPVMPGTKDKDGSISDLKVMFSNGNVIINPKCTKLLQAINEWQYGQHEPDILAALRYAVNGLIKAGKIMPPIRQAKVDNRNHIERFDELERRMNSFNAKMAARSRGGMMQSFKFYK